LVGEKDQQGSSRAFAAQLSFWREGKIISIGCNKDIILFLH
jgi:hypothetical protein